MKQAKAESAGDRRWYADDVARRAEAKVAAGLDDYYQRCAFPKKTGATVKPKDTQAGARKATRKATKAASDRAARREHKAMVRAIFRPWHGRCVAEGVSPVCTGRARDPHELITRGAGGKVSLANSVPICRACHHEANGKVGGNRLVFDWPGKADGRPPRADITGNVLVLWRPTSGKG